MKDWATSNRHARSFENGYNDRHKIKRNSLPSNSIPPALIPGSKNADEASLNFSKAPEIPEQFSNSKSLSLSIKELLNRGKIFD